MRHADTIDKIVGIYLASVSIESFQYKGRMFVPKPMIVSPLLLRGHTCPTQCGACCGSFSLDYLPGENGIEGISIRHIEVNNRKVPILSDQQDDILDRWCRNLDRTTGRCKVYDDRPMACDFELIRFLHYEDKVILIQKQYGRAWAMERLDGIRGALCEMLPPSAARIADVTRKLERMEDWAAHFGLRTRIPLILDWIRDGEHCRPLYIPA